MKILTLSNCPLIESQGSGYVILNYVKGLRQLGHQVDCIGPEAYEVLPQLGKAKRWRFALGMAWLALRQRLFADYDLVELYGAESWLVVVLLRACGTRCVLVHHSNGIETLHHLEMRRNGGRDTLSGESRRWYQFRAERLLAIAFTWVDALVLVSRFEHRFAVEQAYQPPDLILAIETALPDAFLDQSPALDRPVNLGFCGSWLWRKGTDLLADAADQLLEANPHLSLHLAGVGPAFDKFAVFKPEVCDRIHVTAFIASKTDLMAWYRSISIFLVPSYSESFGLVSAEAMSCGCALVATRTGFAADLVSGEEAMVLSKFSAGQLVQAVTALLQDDNLRQRLAMQGYRRVQALRWRTTSQELERFYVRCVDLKRSR